MLIYNCNKDKETRYLKMLFMVTTDDGSIERVNEKDLKRWAEDFEDKEFSTSEAIDYLEWELGYKVEQVY